MITTAADPRREIVDRYVLHAALGDFLVNLGSLAGSGATGPFAAIPELDAILDDAAEPLGDPEYTTLWGGDDSDDPEGREVRARKMALVAEMFAALASQPDYCAEQAVYFASLARLQLEGAFSDDAGGSGA